MKSNRRYARKLDELRADGEKENSSHDFGRDILPALIGRADMYAYDFQTNRIPGDPAGAPVYWRDVGTLDAFFDANMDLRSVSPELNLYNRAWPLRTAGYFDAPAKFIFDSDGRRGEALDSIVSGGAILSGGLVRYRPVPRLRALPVSPGHGVRRPRRARAGVRSNRRCP